ncbi:MBL fold metallo-hydrolase [Marinisporobacter balticus]|uniref:Phosphoribosyl 1,2-cyclic phosphodiesterase n=1 Tax=Marinisporobacter balticus TaxID=2018667 RepID=A0A4R2KXX2_9FIRM|nr:MBL fold metallo-hydrolase [Marinisporobacter balticus]TCO77932.1 phosphoribosyl 1,2-cyclic phosphodiesterase [Marinisporobacter balticus]
MTLRFCSLASGSSGNCQYIASEKTSLLLDAGLSGKRITGAMVDIGEEIKNVRGILVTHEHSDHIKGIGILSRRFNIPIYANNNTWREMKCKIGKVDEENIRYFQTGETFHIEDMKIKPYSISHDASEPVAFSFYGGDAKISIVTDTGYVDDTVKKEITGSDLLMIESNHDVEILKMGSYPWYLKKRIMGEQGHLSNEMAGEIIAEMMAMDIPITNVLLGHLSRENNFPELAFETIKSVLASRNIKVGVDINVDLTYRDRISKVYHIKK